MMAKQNQHPETWHNRLSDGCSGVMDFKWVNKWIGRACLIHDTDMHWGGATSEEKLACDRAYRINTAKGGWLGRMLAAERYHGMRWFTYNEPPRKNLHEHRDRYDTLSQALIHGQHRIEVFNWLGPGRGEDAHTEARGSKESPELLPMQTQPVKEEEGPDG